jgi:hypothetical protein
MRTMNVRMTHVICMRFVFVSIKNVSSQELDVEGCLDDHRRPREIRTVEHP